MKTITIFCREYPPIIRGGIGNTARLFIEELKKTDYNINLITLKYGEYMNLPYYEKVKNISIYRIPLRNRFFFWYKTALFTWLNKKLIKNSDLIHLLHARDCPFIYTAGKPIIANVNDCYPSFVPLNFLKKIEIGERGKFLQYFHYNLDKLFDFITLHRADYIIFNSQAVKKRLTDYYRLQNKKSEVIYKGTNLDEFRNKKLKKDIDILFLSARFSVKGAKEFLKALSIVKETYPNIKVVMAGGFSIRDFNYKKMINDLGLNDIIEMIDFVPHEKVFDFYLRSKIFVIASYWEALGQTAIEAYAAKIPVIGTNAGGLPEIIDKNGILVPPRTVEPLADAMLKLLNNKKLRESMGKNGYERVKEMFNHKKMADSYIDVYKKYITS